MADGEGRPIAEGKPMFGLRIGGHPVKASTALLFAVTTAAVGCRSSSPAGPPSGTSSGPSASLASTPGAGLAGRWGRLVTRQQLASDLGKAGLGPLARYAWLGQTSPVGHSLRVSARNSDGPGRGVRGAVTLRNCRRRHASDNMARSVRWAAAALRPFTQRRTVILRTCKPPSQPRIKARYWP